MNGSRKNLLGTLLLLTPIACLCAAQSAHAYIDLAPTLAKITTDSKRISVVEVVETSPDKHEVTLKDVRVLKGDEAVQTVKHSLLAAGSTTTPRSIVQWAVPGARGVLFGSRNTALVCMGESWYQVRSAADGTWKLGVDRPDLPLAFSGNVSQMAAGVEAMLAGKDTVLTVVAHGADNEAASFDLALNRQSLPGGVRTQRIRANLKMPGTAMSASANRAYMIGSGSVDEADLPALIEKLKSSDVNTRADAANDLRQLGRKAAPAAEALGALLADTSAAVRTAAAAALLQIKPDDARAIAVITKDLDSTDAAVRRDAARAAGFAGPAAKPLVDRLAALLKDPEESTRIAALQSIALLGRDASGAADAVAPLLDQPDYAIDAADALGRIGPAARPALKRLAEMLASDQAPVRWAAVRGMSQIGGPDAHPAVDFMLKALPNATEVEGYNMMIYLSLLGPVANDAAPTVRSTRIKNPVLPSATLWMISKDPTLPWLSSGRDMGGPGGGPGGGGPGGNGPAGNGPGGGGLGGGGGPGGGGMGGRMGGMGGPPGGGGGMGDIFSLIYQAYVRELGDRLQPHAKMLAEKIMDGTSGDVPNWGYEILNCGPNEALATLKPGLASDQQLMRERATVALGYMGHAAASAESDLKAALGHAETEREKRLIEWAIGRATRDE